MSETTELDATDRALLNLLQDGFPIASAPFEVIANRLNQQATEVLARLKRLHKDGLITRFGPFYDAAALGGAFCLCAMAVPEDEFETVLTKVNAFAEVAHNYERDHALNMWFVLATETEDEIASTCQNIERATGIRVYAFPKEKEFFIGFRVAV